MRNFVACGAISTQRHLSRQSYPKFRATLHPASSHRPSSAALSEPMPSGLKLGSSVRHAAFGEGVIIDVEGSGMHARVQVQFESTGSKWLVLAYAKLEILN